LAPDERLLLNESHKQHLEKAGIQYQIVSGKSWEERFLSAVEVVNTFMDIYLDPSVFSPSKNSALF
ncbi:MAG: hypothetical protein LBD11_01800, partial [Candidatus Peribacteria bacterium]|nr:hypothetical protein [Candidatus Peribacteria bacterium]